MAHVASFLALVMGFPKRGEPAGVPTFWGIYWSPAINGNYYLGVG